MKRFLILTLVLILAFSTFGISASAEGKTFIYARSEALQSFDPWNNSNVINYIINQLIYDYLIYYDDGQFKPGLAESWEIGEDNLSITFKIREGVKFHNGEDCTAEDVALHWNRITEDSSLLRYSTLASLKHCDVLDDYTVRFNLNNPDGYFMMLVAQFPAAVPGDLFNEIGTDIFEYNYGTGPWKFVSYSAGHEIVFERNLDYWGTCTSNVDRIIYRTVTEDTTRVSGVITGDITMADGIPADRLTGWMPLIRCMSDSIIAESSPTMTPVWRSTMALIAKLLLNSSSAQAPLQPGLRSKAPLASMRQVRDTLMI